MDLKPVNEDQPWGRYNITGWSWFWNQLTKWEVDTKELSDYNDGDLISDKVCKQIAQAIEEHLSELSEKDQTWLKSHIELWRNCGGYYQY